ncbi:slit homolog 2 protein-like [Mizuhopecten yessoensis]|uniref:Leucine-rich repeat-containing protein 15 n=1 Tax=Mizuhopecten yessoensis TaxID=6573 RepID=A0A210PVP7_MIZYE|nr:slit homolog 2 protein-like [Mizuhopecten yessoensis]OWF40560.1 Leucine-rich repeat-containing protein 15 [Mizuhopecten yessoensis]
MATVFLLTCLAALFGLSSSVVLSCPGSCDCDLTNGKVENCSGVTDFPEKFPNASLIKTLCIIGNNLTSLTTRLYIFKNLETLQITSSGVEMVDNDTFQGMDKLKWIMMNKNLFEFVRPGTFVDLPVLTTLELPNNNISTLDAHTFWNMTNLKILDLSYNKITVIYSDSFGRLPNVTVLDLGHNQLATVPKRILQNFPRLYALTLSGNRIKTVNAYDFTHCLTLRSLYLSDNQISILSDKAFVVNETGGNQSLKINFIFLGDNKLTEFPPLNNLNRLHGIVLSGNMIDSIPSDAMIGFPGLLQFRMSYNLNLTDIQPGAFRMLKLLKTIHMNGNKGLQSLPDGLFQNQKQLHTLFLGNCNLTTFPESLGNWDHLKVLNLINNPLHCDCALKWLSKPHAWNQPANQNVISQLMCASPPEFKHKSVWDLNDDTLPCVDHTEVSNRITNGIIFAIVAIVLIAIVAIILRFRRTMVLRWRYYRYARQTDDVPFTVDNEYSDYPSGDRKLRMSDLERDM